MGTVLLCVDDETISRATLTSRGTIMTLLGEEFGTVSEWRAETLRLFRARKLRARAFSKFASDADASLWNYRKVCASVAAGAQENSHAQHRGMEKK